VSSGGARLRAFNVGEERRLAGNVAGILYLVGAVTASALPLLPGTEVAHRGTILFVAGLSALWGIACLTLVRWERVPAVVSHLSTGMGLPIAATVVACSGGSHSPAKLYLLFVVVYSAYFYSLREALPHMVACTLVTALPVVYDSRAVDGGFVAEIAILMPSYIVLGGVIAAGKQVMIDLRDHARDLSLRDPLTALPNRRALIDVLELHVADGDDERATGLLLVDLDGFKDANTVYGHPVGDDVLRHTGQALLAAAGDDHHVARLGGDEFAITVPHADAQTMSSLSQRVLTHVRLAGRALDLPDLHITASVGWAMHPQDSTSVEELMAAADLALRGSKLSGKDRSQSPLDWQPSIPLGELPA
jgi:diguanylate cyclase (GGDEF)-like protein